VQKVDISKRIADTGAMAIVRVETVDRGIEIAEGMLAGGIDCMEISYTMPNAGDIIKALKERFGKRLVIGAGTVLDPETARHAILNGAQFVIAPNLSKEVAFICNRYQVPYAPGCSSITEAVEALDYGAAFIKAFPISDFYGPKLVSIFKTPLPFMPILASGGISLDNLSDYVTRGVDCCGFGGLLTKGTKEVIAENAKKIKNIIDETRNKLSDSKN
jgi:2-dehydro-3-deoxyphosphogluconate aldolase/(4S)-4-hydroxy-2-oxoglutarate aldolase